VWKKRTADAGEKKHVGEGEKDDEPLWLCPSNDDIRVKSYRRKRNKKKKKRNGKGEEEKKRLCGVWFEGGLTFSLRKFQNGSTTGTPTKNEKTHTRSDDRVGSFILHVKIHLLEFQNNNIMHRTNQ
jgi:hypothetical protein